MNYLPINKLQWALNKVLRLNKALYGLKLNSHPKLETIELMNTLSRTVF